MHSLEPEYLELRGAGEIDAAAASRAVALERRAIFSVFQELRFALYASVAAITSGVAILLGKNLDRIGPLTLILALAAVAAACYGTAIRTRRRGETRSLGGDYLLLLGALIVSADAGYAESQFHWLGSHWSWYLPILAALHAATAYALDSRLVLSVSLASLAGWFGIEGNLNALLNFDGMLRHAGVQAILCAGVILAWRVTHRHLGGNRAYLYVFDNFAANAGFCGALALCFVRETRPAGLAALRIPPSVVRPDARLAGGNHAAMRISMARGGIFGPRASGARTPLAAGAFRHCRADRRNPQTRARTAGRVHGMHRLHGL
jgi:hypothetical protein